jgi:hypothetical protein
MMIFTSGQSSRTICDHQADRQRTLQDIQCLIGVYGLGDDKTGLPQLVGQSEPQQNLILHDEDCGATAGQP